jgi:hypothetical protein
MHRLTKAEHDRYIDDHKIAAYQKHVQALSYEKRMIEEHGPMSTEALDADKLSRKTRRNYNLWAKK